MGRGRYLQVHALAERGSHNLYAVLGRLRQGFPSKDLGSRLLQIPWGINSLSSPLASFNRKRMEEAELEESFALQMREHTLLMVGISME